MQDLLARELSQVCGQKKGRMIRFLLSLFSCQHSHRYKELHGRRLYLICDNCLHAVPALRDEADA